MSAEETGAAKAATGTVHEFALDSEEPTCGTEAVFAPTTNGNVGARRSHDVDLDDVDPWNFCQKCYPDRYEKFPENDHWFDVLGRAEIDGTLGSAYYGVVRCSGCDFEQPVGSKSEAYALGYEHKRYPVKDLGEF